MNQSAFLIVFLCSFSVAASNVHAAQFIPLGEFSDGVYASGATGLSNKGTNVVAYRTPPDDDFESPFLWTEANGRVLLGDPPGRSSLANAVTDDGELVVGTHRFELPGLYEQAFKWSPTSGMVPLDGLPAGATTSRASDVTPDGAFIVGFTALGNSDSLGFEAYRISDSGQLVLLGDLPGGQHYSYASAVSADGSVVTGYSITEGTSEAFVWSEASGMVGLVDASGAIIGSYAENISADGKVVVGYGQTSSDSLVRAFRWNENEGMRLLDALAGFDAYSLAHGASADGTIIVGGAGSDDGPGSYRTHHAALLWDALHGSRKLQQVLVDEHGLAQSLSGWTLIDALDISADGLSIVGTGINPDDGFEAWLVRLDRPLTAPEPGTLALFLVGAVFVARPRYRRFS